MMRGIGYPHVELHMKTTDIVDKAWSLAAGQFFALLSAERTAMSPQPNSSGCEPWQVGPTPDKLADGYRGWVARRKTPRAAWHSARKANSQPAQELALTA